MMSISGNSRTKVIGPSAKEVAYMPLANVPPGYIPVVFEGEQCFIHPNLIKQNEIAHENFVGERKTRIEEIAKTLANVCPKSYQDWENNFRREPNPDVEIDTWFHITMTYKQFDGIIKPIAGKKDLLRLIIHCTMDTPERVKASFKCKTLSGSMVAKVVDTFHAYYA